MKRLHFVTQNNLSQLHDEIMEAYPELAPVTGGDGITRPVIRVEGMGDDIWVEVPDDFSDSAIQIVVSGHTSVPSDPER